MMGVRPPKLKLQARWQGQAGRRCHQTCQFATVSLFLSPGRVFTILNRTIQSAVPSRRSEFSKTAWRHIPGHDAAHGPWLRGQSCGRGREASISVYVCGV